MSAHKDMSVFSHLEDDTFSDAINEFDELFTHSDRAFLLGAGCSKCAGLPLTNELTGSILDHQSLNLKTKSILRSIEGSFDGSPIANIEDYLSELVDLLAISERRSVRGASKSSIFLGHNEYSVTELKDAIDQIKEAIVDVIDVHVDVGVHARFIQAVHRPTRPGRSENSRPVDYLVLNYDTLIESALALEKVPYVDGMNGGNTAWWDAATYHMDGVAARVLKLHGSIDWNEILDDPLPRRVARQVSLPEVNERKVLIWPASTKYREAQRDPYAQLSNLARSFLKPMTGRQVVLTVCGYSFNDSHINSEIERALRESGGELTAIVFTFDDNLQGELKRLHEDRNITNQVRIYARGGFFHGAIEKCSTVDLPWWSFENVTRILEGERF